MRSVKGEAYTDSWSHSHTRRAAAVLDEALTVIEGRRPGRAKRYDVGGRNVALGSARELTWIGILFVTGTQD